MFNLPVVKHCFEFDKATTTQPFIGYSSWVPETMALMIHSGIWPGDGGHVPVTAASFATENAPFEE